MVEGVARLCYQTVLHALLTACKVDLGGRVGFFQSTGNGPVSYTHLDVYKRQSSGFAASSTSL